MSAKKCNLNIGVIGATYTGNRGAEAMLQSTLDALRDLVPGVKFHVLTYAPAADRKWFDSHSAPDVYLHSCTPARIVMQWMPLSLLSLVLPFLRREARERHGEGILRLLKLDAVVDLAGVAFIDGREKFLPFNVLTLAPFILNGVPVFKLSQALGPFHGRINRLLAGWTLRRLRFTAARGSMTAQHLKDLGLSAERWFYAPDTAFSLRVSAARNPRDRDVAILPSSLMAGKHVDYVEKMTALVRELLREGLGVSLIAHSWKDDTDHPRNNDYPVCREIAERAGGDRVRVLGTGMDAKALKTEVSRHRLAITSRFHGMIAALDTATPPLVLGWSHKYREVLAEFSLAEFALPYEKTDASGIAKVAGEILSRYEKISAGIEERLEGMRADCARQFKEVAKCTRRLPDAEGARQLRTGEA